MKRLIVFILFFLAITSYSQKPAQDSTDHYILTRFAYATDELNKPADTIIPKYYLVKIHKRYLDIFRKRFAGLFTRHLTAQWFIVPGFNAYRIIEEQHYLVEKYISANNNWKLSPFLLRKYSDLGNKEYIFLIETNDTITFKKLIEEHVYAAKIMASQPLYHLYKVKTNIGFIRNVLLPSEIITSVDLRLVAPKEEAVINDYDNSTNNINLFFAQYPAVDGSGMTASIKENMFDKTDIDFKNRYKETGLGNNNSTSHATTMATLVAGGGNSFFTGKGVAYGAMLSSSDFINLLPDGANYQQYGISVQNHSYGVGIENFYGSDAAAYDQSMVDNPTLLHVFSSGNAGTTTDTAANNPYKNIEGFANLTGSFKMAKNILTVGSVDSFRTVPALSSKGPAYDGRIKPELVAYGNDGSSGAAAITSGTVLAVQSAYAQIHAGVLPENALTKAILVNSADDINRKGPDFFSGYGNVNTYQAVRDISSGNFFTGSVTDGQTIDFTISIPDNAKNLKVTLVWTDPAAQTNAFTALVNDLDLQLEKQNNTWLPWVLNSAPNADSLKQIAKRGRDSLNVVEQVTIDNPSQGDYTVHVTGYNIMSGPQKFYITYRWDTADHFYFISPAAKDHFTSGDNSIFRWKSTYANNTKGKLEYSVDNGTNWKLVNASVSLTNEYLKWSAPDTFCIALARMTIGNYAYISDTFNFSKQLFPKVGFNCQDSVLIFWNKATGVSQYRVYTLGEKYLEPFANTTDTSIVIASTSSPYIAVTTVLQGNNEGVKSYAFNYNTQGVACYISNFLADLTTNKTALLQLSLGTTYNVASIQFQQLAINGWQTIETISPVVNEENRYETSSLHTGLNTFRAVVTLNEGNTITSSEGTVYFTGNNNFVLMPNPVPQNQNLTILSDNFSDNTVIIYDITGRKVLQQIINGTRSDIAVSRLAKGIYIVAIYTEGTKTFTGKLVIQ